jgi:hypothetical protein
LFEFRSPILTPGVFRAAIAVDERPDIRISTPE